jgi:hypothetical protein
MGKFLLGLVIGVVVGVLVVAYNPNLPDEVRTTLASLTGLVLRGTEEAAEGVGEAADVVADEARKATGGETGEAVETPPEPATTTEGADRPVEPTAPGGEPPRTE